MPHFRERHLGPLVQRSLRFSPIVAVQGHRQVGKTTMVEKLSDKYLTMDVPTVLSSVTADPELFLSENQVTKGLLALDEAQLAPPLFPVLKDRVRRDRRPGQFLLTGSVRFSSRKLIQESLTGRLLSWELLPMDWAELYGDELSRSVFELAKNVSAKRVLNRRFSVVSFDKFLLTGGLPGVFSVRDVAVRRQRFESQINTMLDRDLRLLLPTTLPFSTLRNFLSGLARFAGQPFEPSRHARMSRVSLPTVRKLMLALEAMYLVRWLPCEGDFTKPTLVFEDVGELTHLARESLSREYQILSFLFHNLRTQIHYRPEFQAEMFSFRTRKGDVVPLCFRISQRSVVGIVPFTKDNSSAAIVSARAFAKRYPGSKVILAGLEDGDDLVEKDIRYLGIGSLL